MTRRNSRHHYPVPDAVLQLSLPSGAGATGYATSYPHLLQALVGRPIDAAGYVAVAHMVYGWMPTVLELRTADPTAPFAQEASILESARNGADLSEDQLDQLKASINNSIVGVSKLLHFLCPDRYAIWDSKVYSYMRAVADPGWNGRVDHEDVNKTGRYRTYMDELRCLVDGPAFQPARQRVNHEMGYPVTALRAAEVLMYANAP